MAHTDITVRGARTHNLKNIDVTIPRDKLTVITGLSGSGKSSLAFDTLYAEGQRRYVESLSAYARQFLSLMEKPDVDHIEGLSPAISIEQKSTSHNPRSTVGTITEIYDYLRLLFARVGTPRCPEHNSELDAQTISQMVDNVLNIPEGTACLLVAPVVQNRKGEYQELFKNLNAQGFVRARIDGNVYELSEPPTLDLHIKHTIEVVVDRFKVRDDVKQRLAESFETALALTDGIVHVINTDNDSTLKFSANYACDQCGYSIDELAPRLFSFNSPKGACSDCDGLGVKQMFDIDKIVPAPTLPVSQGAIRSWNKNNSYYYSQLESLAKHFDFSLDTPFNKLPENLQNILLYGSEEDVELTFVGHQGGKRTVKRPFEGVVNHLKRRYTENDSGFIRDELHKLMTNKPCPNCKGQRLCEAARHVFVGKENIIDITSMGIGKAKTYFDALEFEGQKAKIADKILQEIRQRLGFLVNVGLQYLTLSRTAETLSGGEAQRIRLASQIGAGLVGVMYVLDEPSIGLHQRDNQRLLETLFHLRDIGNTVIVVEHDEDAIRQADHVIDIGPGAGKHGGQVVSEGTPADIMADKNSVTGQYLSGTKSIAIPKTRGSATGQTLVLKGATGNNLNNVDLKIPLGVMSCITGVSGSGKSTLINHTLFPIASNTFNRNTTHSPRPFKSITGLEYLDKVVDIDQSPIGRTPRSNPATYTGMFSAIRDIFAATPESRARGYKVGRFSFNVKGGRCEACQGDGVIKVEMHFLPDVYVQCDVCKGQRYNRETLDVRFKGKNIHEVLDMTVEESCEFFKNVPTIYKKCETLMQVGLGYINLGQRATTLSGGEAQRVKLSRELAKRDTGKTLYILDEPTTGLHFDDVKKLLEVLNHLREKGNTIVVIEHNLDVIKTADWVVDLGPEGGDGGGDIVAQGSPESVAKSKASHTGRFLAEMLAQ
jgi:excinuclease ABC subunit A